MQCVSCTHCTTYCWLVDINECVEGTHNCEQICSNTEGSFTCSCRESYSLNEDGNTCSVSCGGSFSSLFGSFKTPDWPDSYPTQEFTCRWEIHINIADVSILIEFNDPYGIIGDHVCETDYVEVLNGDGSSTSPPNKYCGTTKPAPIEIESNRVIVMFRNGGSSEVNDRPGVSISYRAVTEGCG